MGEMIMPNWKSRLTIVQGDITHEDCQVIVNAANEDLRRGGGAGQDEADLLASCYLTSLDLCATEKFSSIAFPSISTGTYGYPLKEASRIALEAIREGLLENPEIEDVRIVCFSVGDLEEYENALAEME